MDGERKRKRAEKAEASRADDQMKRKGREAVMETVAADAAPSPTEEEVEEFFAILRRMRVAVKYFEKSAFNSKGVGDGPQDPTAVAAAADGVKVGGKRVVENSGLDLNAVPEAESSLV
ncbi:hypothetical protein Pfo_011566 [Paulownia fortunei]|nr:hypothetical protein Pfo_011566 [Paulownia fortunei]